MHPRPSWRRRSAGWGKPGFEAALTRLVAGGVCPDNLIVLAYRDAGPPLVLFRQADQPQVFAATGQHLSGRGLSA